MPPPSAFFPARRKTSEIASGSFAWYNVGQGSDLRPWVQGSPNPTLEKAGLELLACKQRVARPFNAARLGTSCGASVAVREPYNAPAQDDQNGPPTQSAPAAPALAAAFVSRCAS